VTDRNDFWNASWADYDNDGFLDLFAGTWIGSKTNFLYHNNGDGTFTRRPPSDMPKISSNQHGSSWGDYDNDGYVDLIVTAGNPEISHNVLYRNNGHGTFTPITNGPIYSELTGYDIGFHGPSWVDYDNDGFLDLFIAGHTSQNHLWHNNGDGSFSKITNSAVVMDSGDSEGRAWIDYDNDGYVDLFVCNASPFRNMLYRNNGDGTFARITNSALTSTIEDSSACAWGDYDNDGFLDVFLANGFVTNHKNSLYRNNGDGTFTKISEGPVVNDRGSGQYSGSCAWGDYDNDGYLDLFVSNGRYSLTLVPPYLYHNNGDGTFSRVLEGSPANDLGNGPGVVWVDYDNDGFLDLFKPNGAFWAENNGGALLTNYLYHNNGNSNAWLEIKLNGTVSNRSAIGANVRIKATIRGKSMWQLRHIFGGDSESNEQPLNAHFGLGDATNIDLVRIEWPSGIVQVITNVASRQFLIIAERQELSTELPIITDFNASFDGGAQLNVTGEIGSRYRFDISTNLYNWAWLGVRTNLTGEVSFVDSKASNCNSRFYRVAAP
jgi:hypothetical protein